MRRTRRERLSTACELMRLHTSARLDGELSEADQEQLVRHLDRCDACARFAHGLAGLTEVLRSDRLPSTPGRGVQAHMGTAARSLVLLAALAIILGGGNGNSTGKNNHSRCHTVWGVATVCAGRA